MADWLHWLTRVGIARTELPRDGWGDRLEQVAHHGLTGSLLAAWGDDLVELSADVAEALTRRHAAAVQTTLRHEQELVRMRAVLRTYGIVVIKGPGLARQTDPERTFTDLDLLVPDGGLRGPVRALLGLGYARTWPDPAPGYLQHTARAVALRHPTGLLVDLHRLVSPGVTTVPVHELARDATTFPIADDVVSVPRPDHHAVLVALHATVGHDLTRPTVLRDLWLLRAAGVTDEDVLSLALRWQVGDPVSRALRARDALFAESAPTAPPASDRVGDHARRLADSTLTARMSTLRGAVVPSPAFVRARYANLAVGYCTRWRMLARLIRGEGEG